MMSEWDEIAYSAIVVSDTHTGDGYTMEDVVDASLTRKAIVKTTFGDDADTYSLFEQRVRIKESAYIPRVSYPHNAPDGAQTTTVPTLYAPSMRVIDP